MKSVEDLTVECVECGQPVIANDPDDGPHYCPDCVPTRSKSQARHDREAQGQREERYRQRIIDNAVNQGGEL